VPMLGEGGSEVGRVLQYNVRGWIESVLAGHANFQLI
jgi:hypothetical protein